MNTILHKIGFFCYIPSKYLCKLREKLVLWGFSLIKIKKTKRLYFSCTNYSNIYCLYLNDNNILKLDLFLDLNKECFLKWTIKIYGIFFFGYFLNNGKHILGNNIVFSSVINNILLLKYYLFLVFVSFLQKFLLILKRNV